MTCEEASRQEDERFWDSVVPGLGRRMGYSLSAEAARHAFDNAEAVELSGEDIDRIISGVTKLISREEKS